MRRLLLALPFVVCCAPVHGQSPQGATTAADHTFERAGLMRGGFASWARPSRAPKKALGYVGGSVPLGGAISYGEQGPAGPADGVLGYDYVGHGPLGRVFLGWSHDPLGPPPGPYRVDGKRVFDVYSIRPVKRSLAKGESENVGVAGHASVGGEGGER